MTNRKSKIQNPTLTKVCLTIAGVDPSGGAGIIADIKTFSAFDCFGCAAIASLTFQNTQGVFGAVNQTAETVRAQVLPILDDFEIAALKTGMLPTREIIEEVARNRGKLEPLMEGCIRTAAHRSWTSSFSEFIAWSDRSVKNSSLSRAAVFREQAAANPVVAVAG